MKPKQRGVFLDWYKEAKMDYQLTGRKYELKTELIQYCQLGSFFKNFLKSTFFFILHCFLLLSVDVEVLRNGCESFRSLFIHTCGLDPFLESLTLASASHKTYHTNFMPKDSIIVRKRFLLINTFLHRKINK